MLLIFILIKFCKIFCCLRLHITHGCWAIDQLVFSIGAIRGLTCSSKIPSKHWQVLFYQNDHRTFHLFILKTSVVWETVSDEYCLGMADSQVVSTKRLDVFCCCCCSLIRKNVFVYPFSVHNTYSKFWLALLKLLESALVVAS